MTSSIFGPTNALAKHGRIGVAAIDSRFRALLVTDEQATIQFVTAALGDRFAVVSAADAWSGLEKASEPGLDLVIADIALTRMSGEELVVAIRRQPHLDGLPILVLSLKVADPVRSRLLADGAQDYVVKPFSAEELRTRA